MLRLCNKLVTCITVLQCAIDDTWCERAAAPWIRANLLPAQLVCNRYVKDIFFNYGHLLVGAVWTLAAPIQVKPAGLGEQD